MLKNQPASNKHCLIWLCIHACIYMKKHKPKLNPTDFEGDVTFPPKSVVRGVTFRTVSCIFNLFNSNRCSVSVGNAPNLLITMATFSKEATSTPRWILHTQCPRAIIPYWIFLCRQNKPAREWLLKHTESAIDALKPEKWWGTNASSCIMSRYHKCLYRAKNSAKQITWGLTICVQSDTEECLKPS